MKRLTPALLASVLLAAGGSAVITIDGLSAPLPSGWKEETPQSPMRKQQFLIPRAAGDDRDAELVVFHFGQGQGGGVDENLKRWKSLFEPPAAESAKVDRFRVGSVQMTLLDMSGTYLYKARPVDPTLQAERRPGHRMLSVVWESKTGPYFLRLVGPQKTVAQHKPAFEKVLKAFK